MTTRIAPTFRNWALATCIVLAGIGSAAAQPGPEAEVGATEAAPLPFGGPPALPSLPLTELRIFDIEGNELYTLTELTGFTGTSVQFLLDGHVSIEDPDAPGFLLLDADTGETLDRAGSENCSGRPVWAPSGREFAFSTLRGSRSTIFRCTVDSENVEAERIYAHDGELLQLDDWSDDGRYLSMSSNAGRLYRFDLEAVNVPDLLIAAELPIRRSQFSPDGRYLAYLQSIGSGFELRMTRAEPDPDGDQDFWTIASDVSNDSEIWWDSDDPLLYFLDDQTRLVAVPVETRAEIPEIGQASIRFSLADLRLDVQRFFLRADGERVVLAVFTESPAETGQLAELNQIAIVDLEGQEIARLGEPGNYRRAWFSPDGSRILTTLPIELDDATIRVLSIDVASDTTTTVKEFPILGNNSPDILDPAPFVWLPDSEHIAYAVDSTSFDEGGYTWVYRLRGDGSEVTDPLYRSERGVSLSVADISSDGRYLLFDSFGWVASVPLADSDPLAREPVDLIREEYEAEQPRLSPDMTVMAYLYNESGANELYLSLFDAATGTVGGEPVRVSENGVSEILGWHADSGTLYYLSGGSPFGFLGGRRGAPPFPGADAEREMNAPAVMAVSVTTEPSLQIGTPRKIVDIPVESVSPDGQRFVMIVPAASEE